MSESHDDKSLLSLATPILLLALGAAVGLGLSRFAYVFILPDMRESLGWNYSQAGFMNTANALGYLTGAALGAFGVRRAGAYPTAMFGTAACVIGLGLSAASENFFVLSFARFVTGVGGAFSFVAGGTLAASFAKIMPSRESFLISLFYIGPAVGILLSSLTVPFLLEQPGNWWRAWALLATIAGGMMLAMAFTPGVRGNASSAPASAVTTVRLRPMLRFLAGYLLYGVGAVAYFTFMVAWFNTRGGGTLLTVTFWSCLAISAILAPWIWRGFVMRRAGGRPGATLVAVTAAASAVPLLTDNAVANCISALAFGSATFTVVAATTAFVRRNFPESAWPSGVGAMTTTFSIGLVIGPVVAGYVTDLAGSLAAGLWGGAGWLVLSALLMLGQKDLATKSAAPKLEAEQPSLTR